jgi:sugar-specific transcriptional regulator TrmB
MLSKIGFTKAEEKVYVTLLKIGLSSTGNIIKKSGLQKSTVYYSLENLKKQGYVKSSTRNNVKYFIAENPSIIKEKVKDLEEEAKKTVEELKKLQKPSEEIQSMISEGYKAVISSLQHRLTVLKKNDEIIIFGSLAAHPKTKAAVLAIQRINREAIRKGVKIRVIFNEKLRKSELARFYEKQAKVRYVKEKIPVGIAIYKDYVYTLVWTDARNPTSVLTQSETISKMYKEFFEGLWE